LEAHRGVVKEQMPRINYIVPFVSPFTGTRRYARTDRYPIFGEDGQVHAVVTYSFDVTESVTVSTRHTDLQYLRTGASTIVDALKAVNSKLVVPPASKNLATAIANADTYKRMLENICLAHNAKKEPSPRRFECARRVLAVVGEYASGEVGVSPVNNDAPHKFSLEISVEAKLYGWGDPFAFDMILRHLIEFAIANSHPFIQIIVTNSPSSVVIEFRLPHRDEVSLPLHFEAAELLSSLANAKVAQRKDGRFWSVHFEFPLSIDEPTIPQMVVPPRRASIMVGNSEPTSSVSTPLSSNSTTNTLKRSRND